MVQCTAFVLGRPDRGPIWSQVVALYKNLMHCFHEHFNIDIYIVVLALV
jgi:hypothetical protein